MKKKNKRKNMLRCKNVLENACDNHHIVLSIIEDIMEEDTINEKEYDYIMSYTDIVIEVETVSNIKVKIGEVEKLELEIKNRGGWE